MNRCVYYEVGIVSVQSLLMLVCENLWPGAFSRKHFSAETFSKVVQCFVSTFVLIFSLFISIL